MSLNQVDFNASWGPLLVFNVFWSDPLAKIAMTGPSDLQTKNETSCVTHLDIICLKTDLTGLSNLTLKSTFSCCRIISDNLSYQPPDSFISRLCGRIAPPDILILH